jgi:COMPASS component SWD2
MKLTTKVVESFSMGKSFKENEAKVNSLDFSSDGEFLITGSDDESLHVYNTFTGKKHQVLYSKKYGVDLVRFTHYANSIIYASKNGWDESIRYLSLHDNRYLRYFKGHKDKVVSLAMSPRDDMFISGSMDNTIRLWDLNTNVCQVYVLHSIVVSNSFKRAYYGGKGGLLFLLIHKDSFLQLLPLLTWSNSTIYVHMIRGHSPPSW